MCRTTWKERELRLRPWEGGNGVCTSVYEFEMVPLEFCGFLFLSCGLVVDKYLHPYTMYT